MNITYTGKPRSFYPAQFQKIEARFGKLSKLLDGRGERQAHVILSEKRSVHKAEITVNYMDNSLVAMGSDADQFTAMAQALEKLEKQVVKLRERRRNGKKGAAAAGWDKPLQKLTAVEPESPVAVNGTGTRKRVYRVDPTSDKKPMTLDEAILELEKDGDYVVFQDPARDRVSVLLRRPDGHFDLVES
jgi:putative sigma-54 modulation protein